MKNQEFVNKLGRGELDATFSELYGKASNVLEYQRNRYINAVKSFSEIFPKREDIRVYSAPGRTEIGGNHTDHQQGAVLAGAVDLDAVAVVSFHNEGVIRLKSEGFDMINISLDDTDIHAGETGTSAIVRGIAAGFQRLGVNIGGFDAYCTSDVVCGSGISSSAAFEILVCTVIDLYYNRGMNGALGNARMGWYAETVYFGKKCGLLDQTVSSLGGLVSIDFADVDAPLVEKINCEFADGGYTLCITDTKSSHADLTDDYVAIRNEMEQVASFFGEKILSRVDEDKFYEAIPEIRKTASDRAVLRAAHFFSETKRAKEEAEALGKGDFTRFLALVNESGASSLELLQNLYSVKRPENQEIPLAIMLSKKILGGRGAVRVHGGGFAGTVQAFVPNDLVETYANEMERIFGNGACHILSIRSKGGIEINA